MFITHYEWIEEMVFIDPEYVSSQPEDIDPSIKSNSNIQHNGKYGRKELHPVLQNQFVDVLQCTLRLRCISDVFHAPGLLAIS